MLNYNNELYKDQYSNYDKLGNFNYRKAPIEFKDISVRTMVNTFPEPKHIQLLESQLLNLKDIVKRYQTKEIEFKDYINIALGVLNNNDDTYLLKYLDNNVFTSATSYESKPARYIIHVYLKQFNLNCRELLNNDAIKSLQVSDISFFDKDDILSKFKIYPVYNHLLKARNVDLFDIPAFIANGFKPIYDTFNIRDKHINDFVSIFSNAVACKHNIVYYVDLDADGVLSGATCDWFHTSINYLKDVPYTIYTNNRGRHRGINKEVIEKLDKQFNNDFDTEFLFITADQGSSDIKNIGLLKDRYPKCKVIITDHHSFYNYPSNADVFVNNQIETSSLPHELSGCYVIGHALLSATVSVMTEQERVNSLKYMTQFMGMSTISDRMDMTSTINRSLVTVTMSNVKSNPLLPFATTGTLPNNWGWGVIPIINAAGRLNVSEYGLDFLTSKTIEELTEYKNIVESINMERKQLTKDGKKLIFTDKQVAFNDKLKRVCVFGISKDGGAPNPSMYGGIVGLLANATDNLLHRPSFVFIENENSFSGSGRLNIDPRNNVALNKALHHIRKEHPGVIISGDGHAGAAGVAINKNKMGAFIKHFDDYVLERTKDGIVKYQTYDIEATPDEITKEYLKEIESCNPFGNHFDKPTFKVSFTDIDFINKFKTFSLGTITHNGKSIYVRKFGRIEENESFIGEVGVEEIRLKSGTVNEICLTLR